MSNFNGGMVGLLLSTISDDPAAGAIGALLANKLKKEDEGRLFTSLASASILCLWMIKKLYGEETFKKVMADAKSYAAKD